MAKSWQEKLNSDRPYQRKVLDKDFADMKAGQMMFIATPRIVDDYVRNIPFGKTREISEIREDLAAEYDAEITCPVTTGIFLRIVSEAAYKEHLNGKSLEDITPFWRAVGPKAKLAKKLDCGVDFLAERRAAEG